MHALALPAARATRRRARPCGAARVTVRVDAAALHDACRDADPRVRAEAFRRLGQLLYRLVWPRVRERPDLHGLAEDAAQEALVTVWRQLEAGRGPEERERFVGWAARIAVNKLLDGLRRIEPEGAPERTRRVAASRQVSLDAAAGDDARAATLGERLADADAPPADAGAFARGLRDVLWRIRDVSSVSERSRTVLLLGYLEDWDDAELAEHLGTTRANVHVIRCRDLAKLRGDAAFMRALRAAADG